MNFVIVKPLLSREEFIQLLIKQFPSLEADVLDDEGLIHLQVGSLANYANECLEKARLDELKRVFDFFEKTVVKVDSRIENALYVSFLEHVEMEGESPNKKLARQLLSPSYLRIWAALRA